MTIILEFDLGDRRTHVSRLKAGYEAARSAAINAVHEELLEGGVGDVTTRVFYDYRQYSATDKRAESLDVELEDEGDQEDGQG